MNLKIKKKTEIKGNLEGALRTLRCFGGYVVKIVSQEPHQTKKKPPLFKGP